MQHWVKQYYFLTLTRCRHHEHIKVHIRNNPEQGRMLPNDTQRYEKCGNQTTVAIISFFQSSINMHIHEINQPVIFHRCCHGTKCPT